jgi:two-component system osmolarity sensor histidine kinase EnvZ
VTLFARSFLLIALLNVAAVLASFQIWRVYEREPRSRALAQEMVSVVNLTRAALVSADPFRRRDLLIELNESEGLRVYPATASEKIDPLPQDTLLAMVAQRVRQALGDDTRFAFARDGMDGFWVSFYIDNDEFWVRLPRERVQRRFGLQWVGWGLALMAIALAGAWLIASTLARPLAALTRAAARLGRGESHQSVPEEGPRELRTLAAAFNRMASDLESLERERAMVLAGISHDLRTPLSRLRLALEMSGADSSATDAMVTDIDEIDAVIGQFLDFARGDSEQKTAGDLGTVLDEVAEHYARLGKKVTLDRGRIPPFPFARMALRRAVTNLVDNALRYAGEPIEVRALASKNTVTLDVLDRGPGIPPSEADRLKRPFTRLDDSRTGAGGAGLGLAIVERMARAHDGKLELLPREGGGLDARLTLKL